MSVAYKNGCIGEGMRAGKGAMAHLKFWGLVPTRVVHIFKNVSIISK